MKSYKPLRRVQLSVVRFYHKHPAMAQRTLHFKVFVSALVIFSILVLCSSLLIK